MKGAEINQNDLAIAEGRSFRPCPHLRSMGMTARP
jgi:hypothetical protein